MRLVISNLNDPDDFTIIDGQEGVRVERKDGTVIEATHFFDNHLRELRQLAEPPWQPIEIAPKNGKPILVRCTNKKSGEVNCPFVVFYDKDFESWREPDGDPLNFHNFLGPMEWAPIP